MTMSRREQARYTHGRWQAGRFKMPGPRAGDDWIVDLVLGDENDHEEERAARVYRPALGQVPDLGAAIDIAIRAPVTGPPRLPAIVRVATNELAAEIQRRRPEVRVEIGPVAALEEVAENIALEVLPADYDEDWSWLANGVTPEQIARLFAAAERVTTCAVGQSWSVATVARVVIPELGLDPAWVNLSLEHRDDDSHRVHAVGIAPHEEARDAWHDDDSHVDEVVVYMSEFNRVSSRGLEEARTHGWPLGEGATFPRVLAAGEDEQDPAPSDVELAIAVLELLAETLTEPHEALSPATPRQVTLSSGATASLVVDPAEEIAYPDDLGDWLDDDYEGDDDLDEDDEDLDDFLDEEDLRFLELDRAGAWHPAPPPAPATVRAAKKPGRNEPCWCGSGVKYKKCHLDQDRG